MRRDVALLTNVILKPFHWVRPTAALMAVVVFYSQVVAPPLLQAAFWEERRQAVRRARGGGSDGTLAMSARSTEWGQAPGVIPRRPSLEFVRKGRRGNLWVSRVTHSVPDPDVAPLGPRWVGELAQVIAPYGMVNGVYVPPGPPTPVVVLLQDVHEHVGAQGNLARLIGVLRQTGAQLVGLEGASGPLNLAPYRAFPKPAVMHRVAEFFLEQGVLSGPEYAGLILPHIPLFWGMEDEPLYSAHVQAVKQSIPQEPEAKRVISELQAILQPLKDQREVAPLSEWLSLAAKLLSHTLTGPEWSRYQSERAFIHALPERLSALAASHQQPLPTRESMARYSTLLPPFERFYELATERDQVLLNNLLTKLSELESDPNSLPLPRGERVRVKGELKVAVLVAGGFHTPGLTRLLKQQRIAYAVITPRLTNLEGRHDALEVFRREKTSLEKLFTGERLTLKAQLGLAKPMGEPQPVHMVIRRGLPIIAMGAALDSAVLTNTPDVPSLVNELQVWIDQAATGQSFPGQEQTTGERLETMRVDPPQRISVADSLGTLSGSLAGFFVKPTEGSSPLMKFYTVVTRTGDHPPRFASHPPALTMPVDQQHTLFLYQSSLPPPSSPLVSTMIEWVRPRLSHQRLGAQVLPMLQPLCLSIQRLFRVVLATLLFGLSLHAPAIATWAVGTVQLDDLLWGDFPKGEKAGAEVREINGHPFVRFVSGSFDPQAELHRKINEQFIALGIPPLTTPQQIEQVLQIAQRDSIPKITKGLREYLQPYQEALKAQGRSLNQRIIDLAKWMRQEVPAIERRGQQQINDQAKEAVRLARELSRRAGKSDLIALYSTHASPDYKEHAPFVEAVLNRLAGLKWFIAEGPPGFGPRGVPALFADRVGGVLSPEQRAIRQLLETLVTELPPDLLELSDEAVGQWLTKAMERHRGHLGLSALQRRFTDHLQHIAEHKRMVAVASSVQPLMKKSLSEAAGRKPLSYGEQQLLSLLKRPQSDVRIVYEAEGFSDRDFPINLAGVLGLFILNRGDINLYSLAGDPQTFERESAVAHRLVDQYMTPQREEKILALVDNILQRHGPTTVVMKLGSLHWTAWPGILLGIPSPVQFQDPDAIVDTFYRFPQFRSAVPNWNLAIALLPIHIFLYNRLLEERIVENERRQLLTPLMKSWLMDPETSRRCREVLAEYRQLAAAQRLVFPSPQSVALFRQLAEKAVRLTTIDNRLLSQWFPSTGKKEAPFAVVGFSPLAGWLIIGMTLLLIWWIERSSGRGRENVTQDKPHFFPMAQRNQHDQRPQASQFLRLAHSFASPRTRENRWVQSLAPAQMVRVAKYLNPTELAFVQNKGSSSDGNDELSTEQVVHRGPLHRVVESVSRSVRTWEPPRAGHALGIDPLALVFHGGLFGWPLGLGGALWLDLMNLLLAIVLEPSGWLGGTALLFGGTNAPRDTHTSLAAALSNGSEVVQLLLEQGEALMKKNKFLKAASVFKEAYQKGQNNLFPQALYFVALGRDAMQKDQVEERGRLLEPVTQGLASVLPRIEPQGVEQTLLVFNLWTMYASYHKVVAAYRHSSKSDDPEVDRLLQEGLRAYQMAWENLGSAQQAFEGRLSDEEQGDFEKTKRLILWGWGVFCLDAAQWIFPETEPTRQIYLTEGEKILEQAQALFPKDEGIIEALQRVRRLKQMNELITQGTTRLDRTDLTAEELAQAVNTLREAMTLAAELQLQTRELNNAKLRLGFALLEVGEENEGLRHVLAAHELGTAKGWINALRSARVWYQVARTYDRRGTYHQAQYYLEKKALPEVRNYLKQLNRPIDSLVQKINRQQRLGDQQELKRLEEELALQCAERIRPQDLELTLLLTLGHVYTDMGEVETALTRYQETLKTIEKYDWESLLGQTPRLDEELLFNRLLLFGAYLNTANAYRLRDQYDKSDHWLNQAAAVLQRLKLESLEPAFLLDFTRTLNAVDRGEPSQHVLDLIEKIAQRVREVEEKDPDTASQWRPKVELLHGLLALQEGRFNDAIEKFQATKNQLDTYDNAYDALATAYHRQADRERRDPDETIRQQAEETYRKAETVLQTALDTKHWPDEPNFHAHLALIHIKQGRWPEATATVQGYQAQYPHLRSVAYVSCLCLLEQLSHVTDPKEKNPLLRQVEQTFRVVLQGNVKEIFQDHELLERLLSDPDLTARVFNRDLYKKLICPGKVSGEQLAAVLEAFPTSGDERREENRRVALAMVKEGRLPQPETPVTRAAPLKPPPPVRPPMDVVKELIATVDHLLANLKADPLASKLARKKLPDHLQSLETQLTALGVAPLAPEAPLAKLLAAKLSDWKGRKVVTRYQLKEHFDEFERLLQTHMDEITKAKQMADEREASAQTVAALKEVETRIEETIKNARSVQGRGDYYGAEELYGQVSRQVQVIQGFLNRLSPRERQLVEQELPQFAVRLEHFLNKIEEANQELQAREEKLRQVVMKSSALPQVRRQLGLEEVSPEWKGVSERVRRMLGRWSKLVMGKILLGDDAEAQSVAEGVFELADQGHWDDARFQGILGRFYAGERTYLLEWYHGVLKIRRLAKLLIETGDRELREGRSIPPAQWILWATAVAGVAKRVLQDPLSFVEQKHLDEKTRLQEMDQEWKRVEELVSCWSTFLSVQLPESAILSVVETMFTARPGAEEKIVEFFKEGGQKTNELRGIIPSWFSIPMVLSFTEITLPLLVTVLIILALSAPYARFPSGPPTAPERVIQIEADGAIRTYDFAGRLLSVSDPEGKDPLVRQNADPTQGFAPLAGKTVVIFSIGGNSLMRTGRESVQQQKGVLRKTLQGLIPWIQRGYRVVVTHGNGPQVGALLRKTAREPPLSYLVRLTQQEIGRMIKEVLEDLLRQADLASHVEVVPMYVEVGEVAGEPTKSIGPGRKVYSPPPRAILRHSLDDVLTAFKRGAIVITGGGGGIPVARVDLVNQPELDPETIRNAPGSSGFHLIIPEQGDEPEALEAYRGISGVIDKDLNTAHLGQVLRKELNTEGANRYHLPVMVISTGNQVHLNFGQPNALPVHLMTVEGAKHYLALGQFPPGSMGPKVKAAIDFLEHGGELVVITTPNDLGRWEKSTRIIPLPQKPRAALGPVEQYQQEFTEVDLTEVVDSVRPAWENRAERRQVKLDVSLPQGPTVVRGDRSNLMQIIDELVKNAIEAAQGKSSLGKHTGTVNVHLTRDVNSITVMVTDNGTGIPSEIRDRIFFEAGIVPSDDPSQMMTHTGLSGSSELPGIPLVNDQVSSKGSYRGLGLYLVRALVEKHAGAISLSTQRGQGTQVTVALPRSPTEAHRGSSNPVQGMAIVPVDWLGHVLLMMVSWIWGGLDPSTLPLSLVAMIEPHAALADTNSSKSIGLKVFALPYGVALGMLYVSHAISGPAAFFFALTYAAMAVVLHELVLHGIFVSPQERGFKSLVWKALHLRAPPPTHPTAWKYLLAPIGTLAAAFALYFFFPHPDLHQIRSIVSNSTVQKTLLAHPAVWLGFASFFDLLWFVPRTDVYKARYATAPVNLPQDRIHWLDEDPVPHALRERVDRFMREDAELRSVLAHLLAGKRHLYIGSTPQVDIACAMPIGLIWNRARVGRRNFVLGIRPDAETASDEALLRALRHEVTYLEILRSQGSFDPDNRERDVLKDHAVLGAQIKSGFLGNAIDFVCGELQTMEDEIRGSRSDNVKKLAHRYALEYFRLMGPFNQNLSLVMEERNRLRRNHERLGLSPRVCSAIEGLVMQRVEPSMKRQAQSHTDRFAEISAALDAGVATIFWEPLSSDERHALEGRLTKSVLSKADMLADNAGRLYHLAPQAAGTLEDLCDLLQNERDPNKVKLREEAKSNADRLEEAMESYEWSWSEAYKWWGVSESEGDTHGVDRLVTETNTLYKKFLETFNETEAWVEENLSQIEEAGLKLDKLQQLRRRLKSGAKLFQPPHFRVFDMTAWMEAYARGFHGKTKFMISATPQNDRFVHTREGSLAEIINTLEMRPTHGAFRRGNLAKDRSETRVSMKGNSESVFIRFEDNGPGMNKDELARAQVALEGRPLESLTADLVDGSDWRKIGRLASDSNIKVTVNSHLNEPQQQPWRAVTTVTLQMPVVSKTEPTSDLPPPSLVPTARPGAIEFIEAWESAHVPQYVASALAEERLTFELSSLGVFRYFAYGLRGDCHDKAKVIREARQARPGGSGLVLVFGDSRPDKEAAQQEGVYFVEVQNDLGAECHIPDFTRARVNPNTRMVSLFDTKKSEWVERGPVGALVFDYVGTLVDDQTSAATPPGPASTSLKRIEMMRNFLRHYPDENRIGMVVYGSVAEGTAKKESDLDYIPIRRTGGFVALDGTDLEFHRQLSQQFDFIEHQPGRPLILHSPLDSRDYAAFDEVVRFLFLPLDPSDAERFEVRPGEPVIKKWVVVARTPEQELELSRLIQERIRAAAPRTGTQEDDPETSLGVGIGQLFSLDLWRSWGRRLLEILSKIMPKEHAAAPPTLLNPIHVWIPLHESELENVSCPICGAHKGQTLAFNVINSFKLPIVRCPHDSMVYLARRPNQSWYDRAYASPQYMSNDLNRQFGYSHEHDYNTNPSILARVARLNLDLFEKECPLAKGHWLDVGAAMGHVLLEARSRGWQVAGVETNRRMIADLRKQEIPTIEGTWADVPIPSHAFNVVSFYDVFEHLLEARASVEKVKQSLVNNGWIVLRVPDLDNLTSETAGALLSIAREHAWYFSADTLSDFLTRSGFQVISRTPTSSGEIIQGVPFHHVTVIARYVPNRSSPLSTAAAPPALPDGPKGKHGMALIELGVGWAGSGLLSLPLIVHGVLPILAAALSSAWAVSLMAHKLSQKPKVEEETDRLGVTRLWLSQLFRIGDPRELEKLATAITQGEGDFAPYQVGFIQTTRDLNQRYQALPITDRLHNKRRQAGLINLGT